jgi:hypothetical protein
MAWRTLAGQAQVVAIADSTVRAMKVLFPFYVISLGVVIIAAASPELMLSVPKYLMLQFM